MFLDYLKVFITGGIICALTQLLMEKTKLLPGRIMVILVVTGVILGALGCYEPIKEFGQAGATVPLTGFGNLMAEGVKEAVREKGLIGAFSGGLSAGAAGISAALIFGYIASLIFDSKMRKN